MFFVFSSIVWCTGIHEPRKSFEKFRLEKAFDHESSQVHGSIGPFVASGLMQCLRIAKPSVCDGAQLSRTKLSPAEDVRILLSHLSEIDLPRDIS